MAQAWKYIAVLTGLLASGSQNVWALETPRSNNSDWDDTRHNSAEIPIESIEQFVQIYGIVKENYVAEKSDEELFLQATKGMVSGLDRYSRYLSAEDYKQLLQYTEADIDKLATKIIDGGKGVWGEIPMTPHAGLSPDNAKLMVKYILSTKK